MELQIASASGNVFGYLWRDDATPLDGSSYANLVCPRGQGFGLDGLFLMQRPGSGPWILDHWDTNGSKTFCSNGSRAALALPDAPLGDLIEAVSNGERILLRRDAAGIGIRLPEGEGCGLRAVPIAVPGPAGFGWVGNPQLVLEVPSVEAVDLPALAPPLRWHAAIPGGTNVNVVEVLALGQARIRSWERGVEGETLCCGTGCAVAAAWLAQRTGQRQWRLQPAGGEAVMITLELDGQGCWHDLWLSGPVLRIGSARPDEALLAPRP